MIILFCLYLLSAKGAPIPHAAGENISPSCNTLDNCRTLWSIVWSSLSTIGLCTWGALHPNIPPPFPDEEEQPAGYWKTKKCWIGWAKRCGRGIGTFIKERVVLFIVALLVPEYILAWAIRQNRMARKIVNRGAKMNEYKWPASRRKRFMKDGDDLTITHVHGFFIVMGGFHLYKTRVVKSDNGKGGIKRQELGTPLHPLDDRAVWNLVNEGKLNLPTADEIQDRSKSDWFAKTLVIFQTLWFVMQCIARGIERLPVTELEIVALAYTIINIGIYIAWWNKPRGVNQPIRVIDTVVIEEGENTTSKDERKEPPTGLKDGEEDDESKRLIDGDPNTSPAASRRRLSRKGLSKLFGPVLKYIAGYQDEYVHPEEKDGVPTFWAGGADEDTALISDSLALLVGIAFGAIHCIAWSFPFPSHRALMMWRLSAVVIAGTPVFIGAMLVMTLGIGNGELPTWWTDWWWGLSSRARDIMKKLGEALITTIVILLFAITILFAPLYIAARATTLVLAFMTLKDLPLGAYQSVQWTNLIPHI